MAYEPASRQRRMEVASTSGKQSKRTGCPHDLNGLVPFTDVLHVFSRRSEVIIIDHTTWTQSMTLDTLWNFTDRLFHGTIWFRSGPTHFEAFISISPTYYANRAIQDDQQVAKIEIDLTHKYKQKVPTFASHHTLRYQAGILMAAGFLQPSCWDPLNDWNILD